MLFLNNVFRMIRFLGLSVVYVVTKTFIALLEIPNSEWGYIVPFSCKDAFSKFNCILIFSVQKHIGLHKNPTLENWNIYFTVRFLQCIVPYSLNSYMWLWNKLSKKIRQPYYLKCCSITIHCYSFEVLLFDHQEWKKNHSASRLELLCNWYQDVSSVLHKIEIIA